MGNQPSSDRYYSAMYQPANNYQNNYMNYGARDHGAQHETGHFGWREPAPAFRPYVEAYNPVAAAPAFRTRDTYQRGGWGAGRAAAGTPDFYSELPINHDNYGYGSGGGSYYGPPPGAGPFGSMDETTKNVLLAVGALAIYSVISTSNKKNARIAAARARRRRGY